MPPLQPQIDKLSDRMSRAEKRMDDADMTRRDTNDKVSAMYQGLMVPQPGYDESLLERMAKLTIDVEGGKRTVSNLAGIGRAVAFVGLPMALIAAALLKLGIWPRE